MARIPVGFISHGAPTLALEVGGFAAALEAWGTRLRAAAPPRGVAIVSAHWVSAIPRTGVEACGPLFYDFGGFDPALREVQYPAPGSPALAAQVRELTGAKAEPTRGLDHGVWVPLLKMFPAADLPVVQVALPLRTGPAGWLALGRALAPLADDGVLVLGSGGLVHNLGRLDWDSAAAAPAPWATTFEAWATAALDRRDLAALGRVLEEAPALRDAHPSVEHLAPLLVAAGAAAHGDALPKPRYPVEGWTMGSLSMRSVEWA
ncbi:MAG: dioxygenase [Myxococcales bacterium]|nr:dioxygenase [Myxococcales bacterium]